ncbi:hypothetical protein K491DRAFT_773470 [Lophiostoma macrostomum CBS 122681]|uniref:DUF6594 domain-containing protein n=1 Tax=Lophiostoma macrostomum CBS 122681 TaxID=1314788 RepID=A0A6A6TRU9_9PLEO|nr:hypothetical protein K491DRAFT_773470 [Lophiostoma macrostomum CBS 122681]
MVESRPVELSPDPVAQTLSGAEDSDSSHDDSGQKALVAEASPHSPPRHSRKSTFWTLSYKGSPEVPDGRFKELTNESVAEYPLGYPSLAAYQNSHPTHRVYRRFGTLRNRVILYRQWKLAKLEQDLFELDVADDKPSNKHRIQSLRMDQADNSSKRIELIEVIDKELKEYDELLEREQRSGLLQKPAKRHFRSLINYLWNRKPIVKSEIALLKRQDDFIMLSEQTESPIEHVIDALIYRFRIAWIRNLFSEKAQREKIDKTKDKYTYLTSTDRIRTSARIVASVLAIAVIGVPLYILAANNVCNRTRLTVLFISLAAFPAAIYTAARPKNLDLFAATATYCAVLSTFFVATSSLNLGQGGPNSFLNTYNGTLLP